MKEKSIRTEKCELPTINRENELTFYQLPSWFETCF